MANRTITAAALETATRELASRDRLHIQITDNSFQVRTWMCGDVLATGKGFSSRSDAKIAATEAAETLGCPCAARTCAMRRDGWAV